MPDKLAIPPDEFRRIAAQAVDFLAAYYEALADRPVLVPTTSQAIRRKIDDLLPPPAPFRLPAARALASLAAYYEALAARPVLVPTTSQAIRRKIDERLPSQGADFDELLRTRSEEHTSELQ